jgi:predicted O-methyltransferase YrrM
MQELGFCRENLPEYLKHKLGSSDLKVCEIGVYEGDYSSIILSALPSCEMYLIDLWDPLDNDFFYSEFEEDQLKQVYTKVKDRFNENSNVKIIKGDSKKLFEDFEDEYFDWIYIDGDHSYEGVCSDLKNWFPKVKRGGVISGHDFDPDLSWDVASKFGVNRAINDFFGDTNEMYLTSEPHYKSWLYFKK